MPKKKSERVFAIATMERSQRRILRLVDGYGSMSIRDLMIRAGMPKGAHSMCGDKYFPLSLEDTVETTLQSLLKLEEGVGRADRPILRLINEIAECAYNQGRRAARARKRTSKKKK